MRGILLPFCPSLETLVHEPQELPQSLPAAENALDRLHLTNDQTARPTGRANHVLFEVLIAYAGRGVQAEADELANIPVLFAARQF